MRTPDQQAQSRGILDTILGAIGGGGGAAKAGDNANSAAAETNGTADADTGNNSGGGAGAGGLGGIGCNLARLRIVGALGDTADSVAAIQDTTVQQAASDGVKQAQDGIKTIAQSLFSGGAPPAEARKTVEAGLTAAGDALASGDQ